MTETLDQYGLALLFGIVALQAMGVPGLPGKTALVTASILAADGHFQIWHVVAVTAIGVALGGYTGYALARAGGRRALVREHAVGRRLASPLAVAERFFDAHGTKAVFLARFLPGLKVVAAPAAGLARMPWNAFALWHTLGALAFALLFGLTGYYAGKGAIALVEALGVYGLLPLAALLALGWLAFLVVRRRRAARWFEFRSFGKRERMHLRDLFHRGRDDHDVSVLGEEEPDFAVEDDSSSQTRVHRMRARNKEAAEALSAILRNYGFETDVRDPEALAAEQPNGWRVEARRRVADSAHGVQERTLVEELAAEHGAEYDGSQPSAA